MPSTPRLRTPATTEKLRVGNQGLSKSPKAVLNRLSLSSSSAIHRPQFAAVDVKKNADTQKLQKKINDYKKQTLSILEILENNIRKTSLSIDEIDDIKNKLKTNNLDTLHALRQSTFDLLKTNIISVYNQFEQSQEKISTIAGTIQKHLAINDDDVQTLAMLEAEKNQLKGVENQLVNDRQISRRFIKNTNDFFTKIAEQQDIVQNLSLKPSSLKNAEEISSTINEVVDLFTNFFERKVSQNFVLALQEISINKSHTINLQQLYNKILNASNINDLTKNIASYKSYLHNLQNTAAILPEQLSALSEALLKQFIKIINHYHISPKYLQLYPKIFEVSNQLRVKIDKIKRINELLSDVDSNEVYFSLSAELKAPTLSHKELPVIHEEIKNKLEKFKEINTYTNYIDEKLKPYAAQYINTKDQKIQQAYNRLYKEYQRDFAIFQDLKNNIDYIQKILSSPESSIKKIQKADEKLNKVIANDKIFECLGEFEKIIAKFEQIQAQHANKTLIPRLKTR